jgi:hypothetical protein
VLICVASTVHTDVHVRELIGCRELGISSCDKTVMTVNCPFTFANSTFMLNKVFVCPSGIIMLSLGEQHFNRPKM